LAAISKKDCHDFPATSPAAIEFPMKIYFDTCSLNRPLDTKSNLRIALEAEAMVGLLARCETGVLQLVWSEVLSLEIDRNPHPQRKAYILGILDIAKTSIPVNDIIKQRAVEFQERGFKPFDALHLATADSSGVDYLCTCDDRFLKKARSQSDLTVLVVSPIELSSEAQP